MSSKNRTTILKLIAYLLFTLTFLPAGWILRNIVNFLVFYHLIKGMSPKICGNWVLLIYLKIPTSLLEDYSLAFRKGLPTFYDFL